MRLMNGRLGTMFARNPLMARNNSSNNNTSNNNCLNNGEPPKRPKRRRRRRESGSTDGLPRPVQFDESADQYRCLCGCFHVKTGAYLIAGVELFLIVVFFLNALLVLLQQKGDLDDQGNNAAWWKSRYVQTAFIAESIGLATALGTILLLLMALGQNSAPLLVPHLIVQALAMLCLLFLVVIGMVGVCTDLALAYRLLNAAPFNEYPGQSTVALPAETAVRIYAFLGLYLISLLLECWFIRIIYNCNRYFAERRKYMRYCLAYSTPMKTLNSARC